ncbi:MAG TPA: cytochrome c [Polyangia bacterium]|nr:cytochrome c [Polyangia bacterium]
MRTSPPDRIWILLVVAAAIYGCAQSDPFDLPVRVPDAGGSGGTISGTGGDSSGSGGFTGSGGTPGTGGSASGGAVGTGGATSSGGRGGAIGTGGASGKGGTTGSGGSIGSGGAVGSGGATSTGGAGGTAPTFTEIYTQILTVHCAGTSCHDPGSQKGVGFSTQSAAYSSVQKLVTPGNGAGSSFYKTVNGGSMPPGGPKLSVADLALIKAWIDAGALNN